MVDPNPLKWRQPNADGVLVNPLVTPSLRLQPNVKQQVDLEKAARAADVRSRHAELSYEKIYYRLQEVPTNQSDVAVSALINTEFSDKELRYVMARNRDKCVEIVCRCCSADCKSVVLQISRT